MNIDTMSYDESINYIIKCYGKFNKRGFNCEREVLKLLDNPHEKLKVIHVAGTNGKGSVCAMLNEILMTHGYRTGVFTSPHLMKFNERIKINNEIISDESFAEEMSKVRAAAEIVFGNDYETLSYFETLTIMAFDYFYLNNVDFAIIEVGLGGRLDPTNIITNPLLSVITSIGYDHMEQLGDTLGLIADAKAGIIKQNRPIVLNFTTPEVYNIIKEIADKNKSDLLYLSEPNIEISTSDFDGISFSVESNFFSYNDLRIRLIGEHQIMNVCCVLLCVEILKKEGILLEETKIRTSLACAKWEGRLEIVHNKPLVILDGAHNIDGAVVFTNFVEKHIINKKAVLLLGVLSHKDYETIVKKLSEPFDTIIFTRPIYKKSIEAAVLRDLISDSGKELYADNNYESALELAMQMAGKDGIVLVAGSLYLVGDIKKYLLQRGE